MSPRGIDPRRLPLHPEAPVGWDGLVHAGFGQPGEADVVFTWCGARLDELPDRRPLARTTCPRCLLSVVTAMKLVAKAEAGEAQRSDLFAMALAYGAAMAAVMATEVGG